MTRVSSNLSFFSDALISAGTYAASSSAQWRNDAAFEGLSGDVCHWQSMSAMTLGALTYRIAGLALRQSMPVLGRYFAPAFALAGEVAVYEGSQRGLMALSDPMSAFSHLFAWSGTHGLWEALRRSYVDFAFLKMGGKFHSQNLFLQHLTQASAMVAGHEATARFGWVPHESGSLFERLANAEAMNLRLGIAMGFAHAILPQVKCLEMSVERQTGYRVAGHSFEEPLSGAHVRMSARDESKAKPFEQALQRYFKELEDGDPDVRRAGLKALAVLGPQPRIAEKVLSTLYDPEQSVRLDAIAILGRWNEAKHLEALTELLEDADDVVQRAAEDVLRGKGFFCLANKVEGAAAFPDSEVFLQNLMEGFGRASFSAANFYGLNVDGMAVQAHAGLFLRTGGRGQDAQTIPLPGVKDQTGLFVESAHSYRGPSTLFAWRAEARLAMTEAQHALVMEVWLEIEKNLEGRIAKDSPRLREVLENACVEERFGALTACRKRAFANRMVEALKCLGLESYPHVYEILLEQVLEHSQTESQARSLLDQYFNFCRALGACDFPDRFFSSFDRSVLYGEGETQAGERWAFDEAVEDLVDDVFARIYTDLLTRGISAKAAIQEVETLIEDGSLHRSIVYRWAQRRAELSPLNFGTRPSHNPIMAFEMAFMYLETAGEVSSPLDFREPCGALLEIARSHPGYFSPRHWQVLLDVFHATRLFEVNEIFHELLNASDLFSMDSTRAFGILLAHLDYQRAVIETHPVQAQEEDWIDPSWHTRQRVYILAQRYPQFFPAKYLEIDDSAWVRAGTRHILASWLEEVLKLFMPLAEGELSEALDRSLVAGGYVGSTPLPDELDEDTKPFLLTRRINHPS